MKMEKREGLWVLDGLGMWQDVAVLLEATGTLRFQSIGLLGPEHLVRFGRSWESWDVGLSVRLRALV